MEKIDKLTLRWPESLHKRAIFLADLDGLYLNELIVKVVTKYADEQEKALAEKAAAP